MRLVIVLVRNDMHMYYPSILLRMFFHICILMFVCILYAFELFIIPDYLDTDSQICIHVYDRTFIVLW